MRPRKPGDTWNRMRPAWVSRLMTHYMMHYALNITLVAICGAYILTALALWASEDLLRPTA
jgi:hypothetical protein